MTNLRAHTESGSGGTVRKVGVLSCRLLDIRENLGTLSGCLPVTAGSLLKAGALAVSSEKEFAELPDVPTLKESGVDVTVTNWRGVMAPPGISDEQKNKLIKLLDGMHASKEWQDAIKKNGWVDAYASGDEFEAMIKEQDTSVRKLMSELGL